MSLDLIVREDLSVTVTGRGRKLVKDALQLSALVCRVANPEENVTASTAHRALRSVELEIEKARKAVKEPVLDLCRKIDFTAKALTAELGPEIQRIADLQSEYQAEQNRIAREAERALQIEVERIERERRAEGAKLREAAEIASNDAKKAADIAAALARNEELRKQELIALSPPKAPDRADGQTVREEWAWEVCNIWDLARSNPGFVKIEARAQEINDALRAFPAEATPVFPGLRIYRQTKVGVRLNRGKVVDV